MLVPPFQTGPTKSSTLLLLLLLYHCCCFIPISIAVLLILIVVLCFGVFLELHKQEMGRVAILVGHFLPVFRKCFPKLLHGHYVIAIGIVAAHLAVCFARVTNAKCRVDGIVTCSILSNIP